MHKIPVPKNQIQILASSDDLNADMDFFNGIGFRLEKIYPSDDPAVAIMSGHGVQIRLDKSVICPPPNLHLLIDDPISIGITEDEILAPNGTKIKILPRTYELKTPETKHRFEVRQLRDSDPWVIGRAGMLYRDLIPDRLGGSIIASHINIPDGGPVPDVVHYHTIGFQLIFCYKGWVKLVYEDQGPPFKLYAGECVTQPPEIRHRVLESSDDLEVIEIGVPAEHMTTIDHEMKLPNDIYNPDRKFHGQRFCHHKLADAVWKPWRINGFKSRDTGISAATNNLSGVKVVKAVSSNSDVDTVSHDADISFTFIMSGSMELYTFDSGSYSIRSGDAFVIPPKMSYQILNCSDDLELLEVTLPGDFKTFKH